MKYRYVRCVKFGENRQQLVKSTVNRRVEAWQDSRRFVTRLFHGTWHGPVGLHIKESECVQCGIVQQTPFLHVSKIFQRCKSNANIQNIEMKLNLTWKVKLNHPPKQ